MADTPATLGQRAGGTATNIVNSTTSAATNAKIKTPAGNAPVLPLLMLGAGLYLMWFGVHYFRDANVIWPSDPIKSALQGNGSPAPTKLPTVTAELATSIQTAESEAPGPANAAGTAPALPSDGAYTETQVETIWRLAGGAAGQATFAAGVAMAESGGNPKVTSPNPDGGTNVGLWQLDTKGVGAGHTVTQLQNAATNAKITVGATKNGTDWAEWADAYTASHGTGGAGTAAAKAASTPGGP